MDFVVQSRPDGVRVRGPSPGILDPCMHAGYFLGKDLDSLDLFAGMQSVKNGFCQNLKKYHMNNGLNFPFQSISKINEVARE